MTKLLAVIGYYILDETEVKDLYSLVNENLKKALSDKSDLSTMPLCKYQLQVFMFLTDYMEQESYDFQGKLLNFLLES